MSSNMHLLTLRVAWHKIRWMAIYVRLPPIIHSVRLWIESEFYEMMRLKAH